MGESSTWQPSRTIRASLAWWTPFAQEVFRCNDFPVMLSLLQT